MTLLEYAKSLDTTGEAIYDDPWNKENGIYVDLHRIQLMDMDRETVLLSFFEEYLGSDYFVPDNADSTYYLDGADFEFLNQTELVIDEGVDFADFHPSLPTRPYFRLRGKRVTEEQAFDIIRRTDNYFRDPYRGIKTEGTIDLWHFHNDWFDKGIRYGWCHPNGVIGMNDHTHGYKIIRELLRELTKLKYAFPYLDFVAAVTSYNERPWFIQARGRQIRETIHSNEERRRALCELEYEEDPDFLEYIKTGVWLHDGAIEFLGPERARQVYQEYEEKYSEENKDIYVKGYYNDHGIVPADSAYLRRCSRANGVNTVSPDLDPERASQKYMERLKQVGISGQEAERLYSELREVLWKLKKEVCDGDTDTETASGSGKRRPAGGV